MPQSVFLNLFPKRKLPDNFVSHLHYRWTVVLLLTLSFIVTSKLLLGDSFSCAGVSDSQRFIETKCYAEGIYTLPGQLLNYKEDKTTQDPSTADFRRYQTYYPWVNLFLLLHAFNFYLPHFLWKCYESGYMGRLTSGLEKCSTKEEKRGTELCYLAKYVIVTQGKHKLYTFLHILCEVLNYGTALSHTLWLVYFFDVTGVPDFLHFQVNTWQDFRQFYFPTSGTCSFKESESIIEREVQCLLPLNDLYRIIFLFIHAWYIFLTILSGAILVYRIALLVPSLRVNVLRFHAPLSDRPILKSLCNRLSFSDWFFLSRFQRVMTDIDFAQMLEKIAVISQCKSLDAQQDNQTSLCDDISKDFEYSDATSPV